MRRSRSRRPAAARARTVLLAAASMALLAEPAAAQFGIIEGFARRFSDISFFGNLGGLAPVTDEVEADLLSSFGVEVLFEIGSVDEPTGPAPEPDDSVRLTWREMRVVRSETGVDTVYFYDVERVETRAPTERIWTFELGVGYGQTSGFESKDPTLDLRGAVRDLPSVSLYASYEPSGTYFGLRSGFMRLEGLQVFDPEGNPFDGDASSFLTGVVIGEAVELLGLNFFVEGAYSIRHFPSIDWGRGPLPTGIPRELTLSGWSVGVGVQFGIGG